MSKTYDVFICHASEDKDDFVRPLAEGLRTNGLTVWYDESDIPLGTSLRASIDKGLLTSRFGVVVVSPYFFAKDWPQRELGALIARENAEQRTIILPVWYQVDCQYVAQHSPLLADKKAIESRKGIAVVIGEICSVIRTELENIIMSDAESDTQRYSHTAVFTIGSAVYTLDGLHNVMDVAPYISVDSDGRGRVFLPIQYLAHALGIKIHNIFFDAITQTITIMKDSNVVCLTIGSTVYTVNGIARIMDVAPQVVNGKTMLPPRWIVDAVGGEVGWNPVTQQILIKY